MTAPTDLRQPRPGVVLVTGGCGFLGRHLVTALVRRGHAVRVLDDRSTGDGELPAGASLVRGSVLDPAAVAAAAHDAWLVFHLAGVVGMRLATGQAGLAYEIAVTGTEVVLRGTGDCPVVLFSSSAVYGLGGGRMSEDDPIDRSVPLAYDGGSVGYATGKWEMEQLGLAAAAAGRRVLVVRPFNVVGDGQSSAYGMVLPTFVARARAGRPVVVYGDGTQRRCFSDVGEFTRLVLRVAECEAAWRPGRNVVNVGATGETSIAHLADLVLAATGSASGVRHEPYDSQFPGRTDVRSRVPVTDRLEDLAGPVAWPPVAEIVRRLAARGLSEMEEATVGALDVGTADPVARANHLADVTAFRRIWDEGRAGGSTPPPQRRGAGGHVNLSGDPDDPDAADLVPSDERFWSEIEAGAVPLVHAIVAMGLMTYSSCEGHPTGTAFGRSKQRRHVGVLPRTPAEYERVSAACARAADHFTRLAPATWSVIPTAEPKQLTDDSGRSEPVIDLGLDRVPGGTWDQYFAHIDDATTLLVGCLLRAWAESVARPAAE